MLQKGMQLEEVEKERIFEECMAQYRKEYRSTVDGTPFVLEGTVKGVKKGRKSPPRVPFKFTFGAREAKAMYNTAFAKPLSVLDDEFDFQADKSRDTVVMLSGGSFLNDEVLKRTIESIEGHRLAYLPWTEELGDTDKRYVPDTKFVLFLPANGNYLLTLPPCLHMFNTTPGRL